MRIDEGILRAYLDQALSDTEMDQVKKQLADSPEAQAMLARLSQDRYDVTPHLDALAAWGTCFEHTYCASPLCVPSRMTFLTGRHCSDISVWTNGCTLASDIPTFAHGLGIAGYEAVLGGRIVPPAPVALPAFLLLTALIRPLLPLFAHAIGPIAVVVATTAVGPVLL